MPLGRTPGSRGDMTNSPVSPFPAPSLAGAGGHSSPSRCGLLRRRTDRRRRTRAPTRPLRAASPAGSTGLKSLPSAHVSPESPPPPGAGIVTSTRPVCGPRRAETGACRRRPFLHARRHRSSATSSRSRGRSHSACLRRKPDVPTVIRDSVHVLDTRKDAIVAERLGGRFTHASILINRQRRGVTRCTGVAVSSRCRSITPT